MGAGLHQRHAIPWRWLLPVLLALVACAAAFGLAWRPAIAPLPASAAGARQVDAGLVARGANLAAIGNCATCHSATPAQPFAGGLGLRTPFGTVYSTNITPDAHAGIGAWTEAAFTRAMRDGVSRDGHLLYPAFPYDHYTRLADADIHALYAYLMTREAIAAPTRTNALTFPFGLRPLLAGWNLLYLRHGGVDAEPRRSAEWNRGAYLAEALGHCSACHSPRNALGAQDRRRYLGGGEAEGWYVPALNADTPSPLPWTVPLLTTYLRTGIAPGHAIAAGPMQGVTASLSQADARDVQAIAVYIHSLMGAPTAARQQAALAGARQATTAAAAPTAGAPTAGAPSATTAAAAPSATPAAAAPSASPAAPGAPAADGPDGAAARLQLGEAVYAGACARCHDSGRTDGSGGALQLSLAVALYDPDPRSLLHIIREGVAPPANQPGRWMPGFAAELGDEQVVALATYLRQHTAHLPPWPDVPAALQKAKQP